MEECTGNATQEDAPVLQVQPEEIDRKARVDAVWEQMNKGVPSKTLKGILNNRSLKTSKSTQQNALQKSSAVFRALSDQLYQDHNYQRFVRMQVIKQLKRHRKLYESNVPMKYRHYVRKMKKLEEWGDHLTRQAAAHQFEAKICLVTSFRDTGYIEILPKDKTPQRGYRYRVSLDDPASLLVISLEYESKNREFRKLLKLYNTAINIV